jgi:hypothetical protein
MQIGISNEIHGLIEERPLEALPTTNSHEELAAGEPPTSTRVLSEVSGARRESNRNWATWRRARTLSHVCNDLHQLPPTQHTWRKSSGLA